MRSSSFSTMGTAFPRVPLRNDPCIGHSGDKLYRLNSTTISVKAPKIELKAYTQQYHSTNNITMTTLLQAYQTTATGSCQQLLVVRHLQLVPVPCASQKNRLGYHAKTSEVWVLLQDTFYSSRSMPVVFN